MKERQVRALAVLIHSSAPPLNAAIIGRPRIIPPRQTGGVLCSCAVARELSRGLAQRAAWPAGLFGRHNAFIQRKGGVAASPAGFLRGVAVEAAQLRKGDFFDFKGKRCVVMKTSQQINNRKAFAIVEFREIESGNKHKETLQAGDKVCSSMSVFEMSA